jgi:signal transduction histidine kinase
MALQKRHRARTVAHKKTMPRLKRKVRADAFRRADRAHLCAKQIATEGGLRRINAALEAQARSIGQALHDEAGQVLTAAFNALAEATNVVPSCAGAHLDEVKRHLDAIEDQFHRIAHELRPRILEDLGLVPALRFLADGLRIRRGISVTFAASVDRPVPMPVETAVYRLVQESITNISKHAHAQHVVLEVEERGGFLKCRIRDDGVGVKVAQQPPSGLGLIGIRDRVQVLGGTLMLDSAPGQGTALTVTIPL